ncbi:NADPH-dependent FMN reductase [Sphingobacteriaceae bacterium]|nr:NADPH-dependent FMN reductase [Sphingobacteriaceae bacterium]
MKKIVVVSCTNRPNSNTLKVSKIYENILKTFHANVSVLDFTMLPENLAFGETFGKRSDQYARLIDEYVSTVSKFIFIIPEYNGSFPGILKTFLDSMHPKEWANKDACLVGIADGRAGNLRGMEHLTGILQYLKMHVYHDKLPISIVNKMMDADGNFSEGQMKVCMAQVEGFLQF